MPKQIRTGIFGTGATLSLSVAGGIKKLRTNNNLSQEELANELGITKSTISAYEKGIRTPSLEVMVDMSKCFNTSLDVIAGMSSDVRILNVDGLTNEQYNILNSLAKEFRKANNKAQPKKHLTK